MGLRKVAFPTVMLATSLYILLPTADEIVIHPTLGLFFSYFLHIPFVYGVLLSIIVYRSLGVGCLLTALVTGGKPIYLKLKNALVKRERKMKPIVPKQDKFVYSPFQFMLQRGTSASKSNRSILCLHLLFLQPYNNRLGLLKFLVNTSDVDMQFWQRSARTLSFKMYPLIKKTLQDFSLAACNIKKLPSCK